MIKFKYLHMIECDKCGRTEVQLQVTRRQFLDNMRSYGWSIGNKCLCPLCCKDKAEKQANEVNQMVIFDFMEEEQNV